MATRIKSGIQGLRLITLHSYFLNDKDDFWSAGETLRVHDVQARTDFSVDQSVLRTYQSYPDEFKAEERRFANAVFLSGLVHLPVPTPDSASRIVQVRGDISSFQVNDTLSLNYEMKIVVKGKTSITTTQYDYRVTRVGERLPGLEWVPGKVAEVESSSKNSDLRGKLRARKYVSLELGQVVKTQNDSDSHNEPGEISYFSDIILGAKGTGLSYGADEADAIRQLSERSRVVQGITEKDSGASKFNWGAALAGISQAMAARKGSPMLPYPGLGRSSETQSVSTGERSGPIETVIRSAAANPATSQVTESGAPGAQTSTATGPTGSGTIDGCPTSVAHLAPQLPVCSANDRLMEIRELALATDLSFRKDLAAGWTFKQIAVETAKAARDADAALKQDEEAMIQASANARRASDRLAALRATPPVCNAGPPNTFGMSESAYQAYVATYIVALVNRATSAAAACRARAER